MSGWTISPDRRATTEARLCRKAKQGLGVAGLAHIRRAPAWFRGVHNGWPVLVTHRTEDLIALFAMLVARDPSVWANYRAFLALCRRSNYQPEFLSSAGEWVKRGIDELRFLYESSRRFSVVIHRPGLLGGLWDDPAYHGFGNFNPRVADEIVALALSCSPQAERVSRGTLPLVREFYSWKAGVIIKTDDALQKLISKVLSHPQTIEWCVRHPFTANLTGIELPAVTCEDDQTRMHARLRETPPKLIGDLPGARFPTI